MASSLREPSRAEQWAELLAGELTMAEAARFLVDDLWSARGMSIGGMQAGSLGVTYVRVADAREFGRWLADYHPELLDEYHAACALRALEVLR